VIRLVQSIAAVDPQTDQRRIDVDDYHMRCFIPPNTYAVCTFFCKLYVPVFVNLHIALQEPMGTSSL
jgi:hypothetical protein